MKPFVTPEDHDAGYKELPLEYRRESVPDGWPDQIRVRALSYIEAAEVNEQQRPEEPEIVWRISVLLTALPAPHNTMEFVNQLKVSCVNQLILAALYLAYGTPESLPDGPTDGKKKRTASVITAPA